MDRAREDKKGGMDGEVLVLSGVFIFVTVTLTQQLLSNESSRCCCVTSHLIGWPDERNKPAQGKGLQYHTYPGQRLKVVDTADSRKRERKEHV